MRRGIGAIFTTGVALVGAFVVVANPVVAPPADLRVPAVELSAGASASTDVPDQSLLNAIAQDPAEAGLTEVLKRLLAKLVTDAAELGGQSVDGALWAQASLAQRPAPTAAASPHPSAQASVSVPVLSSPRVSPSGVVTDIPETLVQHIVISMVDGVGYADSAVTTALQAAAARLVPSRIVGDAIGAELGKPLAELNDFLGRPVSPTSNFFTPAAVTSITGPVSSPAGPARRALAASARSAIALHPARTSEKATAGNGATDLSDGNKTVARARHAQGQVRRTIAAAVDAARASAKRADSAVGKAIGSHRS